MQYVVCVRKRKVSGESGLCVVSQVEEYACAFARFQFTNNICVLNVCVCARVYVI